MESGKQISLLIALLSIIAYGIIWAKENISSREHNKGLAFLVVTEIGLISSLVFSFYQYANS